MEYGVSRPWYWPFIAPFEKLRRGEVIKLPDLEASRKDLADRVEIGSSHLTSPEICEGKTSYVSSERDRTNPSSSSDSALMISKARKWFGNKLAVNDVDITVERGEVLALVGPNGAGKTTLVSCILGLYRLSSGTAIINGFDITRQQDQVYRYVGVCPQHEILWPDLTCEEHLLFYCRLKGVDAKDEKQVVSQSLEQVELVPERRKLAKHLSGGQKRRLSIAIAFVGRPAVVFLDEPTTGKPPSTMC